MQEALMLEDRLIEAMIRSDNDALNHLIADSLIFINHVGQQVTKSQDLEMHSSGQIHIDSVTRESFDACEYSGCLVVNTCLSVTGTYAGQSANGRFHYLRTWAKTSKGWQVVGVKSSIA
ncbi:nuclear transport factor 2 family protein [Nissabacter sp. SGAir0207]|uniref:nuclear transport factor 2 family protein n=1 Tax=Nissabacter sp. SGAir0207 TaxID=2126321 RepID=UPI0010CD0F80|nr:nuclear transport factor 2 family protein [Nissabacter sp. SGAir0207]QCR38071.1 nuclear transport factor 2 family protein [Nissabacter sp. SGAir0207]